MILCNFFLPTEDDVVAVFINYSQGRYLSEKVDAGIPITMNITLLDFVVYKVSQI